MLGLRNEKKKTLIIGKNSFKACSNTNLRTMNAINYTATYPPKFPLPAMGGYRYFFNGQESDAEVYGSGSLAGYEFRQYDTRLGRWWGIDRKAAKYPSLSPYQFCADNPIKMVDVDGSDFVVVIDNSGENKTITIQMNIYTASQEAYDKLLPAVKEINDITKVVTVDGVEYTLKFAINPVAPDSKKREDYYSNLSDKEMMIVNAKDQARDDGCYGNAFMGSTEIEKSRETESGKIHITGGQTSSGKYFSMNIWKNTRFIDYHKLISHEILHLLGLDDKGKPYYPSEGRMEYTATPDNGFEMKDISNDDIRMIIKYMLDNNGLDVEGAKVRIDYINGSAPIDTNAEIKVE